MSDGQSGRRAVEESRQQGTPIQCQASRSRGQSRGRGGACRWSRGRVHRQRRRKSRGQEVERYHAHTSLFSGDCPVPGIRKGAEPPKGLHLCALNPGGIIETLDGARIRFDGKGYGLSSPEKYRVSMTVAFATDDPRYQWLTPILGAMEGEFDSKAGTATWNVYLPRS